MGLETTIIILRAIEFLQSNISYETQLQASVHICDQLYTRLGPRTIFFNRTKLAQLETTRPGIEASCVHASHAKSCDLRGTKGHACTHSLNRNNTFMNTDCAKLHDLDILCSLFATQILPNITQVYIEVFRSLLT